MATSPILRLNISSIVRTLLSMLSLKAHISVREHATTLGKTYSTPRMVRSWRTCLRSMASPTFWSSKRTAMYQQRWRTPRCTPSAAHTMNRSRHTRHKWDYMSHEVWHRELQCPNLVPNIALMRAFRYPGHVHIPAAKRVKGEKFAPHTMHSHLVGMIRESSTRCGQTCYQSVRSTDW
jgi:hypothetical protein